MRHTLRPHEESPLTQKTAEPNFDRVARLYRWAEYLALGPLLTQTREHFLPALHATRQALVLGDGDGRFLAKLLLRVPGLGAQAVDTSAVMLRLLQNRCARAGVAGRVQTRQMSVTAPLLLEGARLSGIDLIVTHFVLDCLSQSEVDRLAAGLAAGVAPGCLWVVSEFGLPQQALARWAAGVYIGALYLAFRLLTGLRVRRLPDPASALRSAGFVRLDRAERLGGLIYTELWQRSSLPIPGK